MRRISAHLTYANVISTLSLFLLLGGGAYAAANLSKNSVGTKQLKNGAVTAAKIKNGAVIGAKIQLSSVGTVPSASHADTATSAINADTATSASSASNASQLGGSPPSAYRDRCPTETSLVAPGLCMTQERGASGWNNALGECGEDGFRLPTPGEAQLMFPKATPEHSFWTDDFWVNGTTSTALVYWPEKKGLFAVESAGIYWIYCVTTPTNT
jgi:hypothetical protein